MFRTAMSLICAAVIVEDASAQITLTIDRTLETFTFGGADTGTPDYAFNVNGPEDAPIGVDLGDVQWWSGDTTVLADSILESVGDTPITSVLAFDPSPGVTGEALAFQYLNTGQFRLVGTFGATGVARDGGFVGRAAPISYAGLSAGAKADLEGLDGAVLTPFVGGGYSPIAVSVVPSPGAAWLLLGLALPRRRR